MKGEILNYSLIEIKLECMYKMEKVFSGMVNLNGKEYPYNFVEDLLNITVKDDFQEFLFQKEKELPWDYIDGNINASSEVV